MANDLLSPVLTGIKNVNFFEGRLLTARDLTEQEQANRELRWSLGKALGTGIFEGMQVSIETPGGIGEIPVVQIEGGIAINGKGQVLEIRDENVSVELSKAEKPGNDSASAIFKACAGPPDTKQVPNGVGIYLLTVSPTAVYEDFAPKSGLLAAGDNPECGRRYLSEGVQFRLVEIGSLLFAGASEPMQELVDSLLFSATPAVPGEPSRLSRLQNTFAHLCLDSDYYSSGDIDAVDNEAADYRSFNKGVLHELYAAVNGLSDCDVPLAAIYWTESGIAFLDNWSVRRMLPDLNVERRIFKSLVSASMQQFQDQLAELENSHNVQLSEYFQYVPSVGRIPVEDTGLNSTDGFRLRRFFGSRFNRLPSIIDASQVPALIEHSFGYPPVPVAQVSSVNLYMVRENIEGLLSGDESQLYAYFSTPEVGSRFCSPPQFIDSSVILRNDDFLSLFEASYEAYRQFQFIIMRFMADQGQAISTRVLIGMQAIDQVLYALESVIAALRSGCLDNHDLYRNFQRIAERQRNFVTIWRDILSELSSGVRTGFSQFEQAIAKVIVTVAGLIEEPVFQGLRGLIVALADHDVESAYITQQEINQSFTVNLGTGATGILELSYVNPPVSPPEDPGAAPAQLVPGEYVFGFELESRVTAATRVQLTPRIEQFGWEAVVVDESNAELAPPYFLDLEKSDDLPDPELNEIKVKVRVPESGDATAALVLGAEEDPSGGGIPPAQQTIALTRGGPIPVPDDRLALMFSSYGVPPDDATPFGGGIRISRSELTSVAFLVRSDIEGQFVVNMELADGSSWDALQFGGAQSGSPRELDFDLLGATLVRTIPVAMVPGSGAGGDTDLVLTLRSREGSAPAVDPPYAEIYRLPIYIRG